MISEQCLLLKIVASNGSIYSLVERGYSIAQITQLIQKEIDRGNLYSSLEGIELTEQGKQLLEDLLSENNLAGGKSWVLPQEHMYRTPLDPNTIVLPKKRI